MDSKGDNPQDIRDVQGKRSPAYLPGYIGRSDKERNADVGMACRMGGKHGGKYGIRNTKSASGGSRAAVKSAFALLSAKVTKPMRRSRR